MKRKLLVEYQPELDHCAWLLAPSTEHERPAVHEGTLEECLSALDKDRTDSKAATDIVVVLNTPAVSVRKVSFSEAERRHILKTVAYELEESLVNDLDNLHLSYAKPGSDSLQVAVIEKQLVSDLLAEFKRQGFEPAAIIALPSLLNAQPGEWKVAATGNCVSASSAEGEHFTTSLAQGRIAWNAVARVAEELPTEISIYHADEQVANQVLDQLPPAMAAVASLQNRPWYSAVDWSRFKATVPNLLQGEFSPSVGWNRLWSFWRLPAIIFASALAVFTLGEFLSNQRLEDENLRLRQEMTQIYQESFPGSAVRDPEAQMRSKLKALGNVTEQSVFLPLLYQSAQTLESFDGVKLLTANFDARNNELRVDLLAQKFEDIEKIQTRMQESGIAAELVNTNSVDGGERARLKLKNKAKA